MCEARIENIKIIYKIFFKMALTRIRNEIKVKGDDSRESLGLVHVITGDGKGKTTSSLGIAVRAVGNNLRVHMIQFLKSGFTGEIYSAKKLGFEIEQFGVDAIKQKQLGEFKDMTGTFVFNPDIKEKEAALLGWEHAKKIIKSGKYDVIILDEINCVLAKELVPLHEVLGIVKSRTKMRSRTYCITWIWMDTKTIPYRSLTFRRYNLRRRWR